ncbi:DUF397 domain-containing protein [Streptomyces sp. ISL-100]|uniref:DUF397 domain-containing protein n=1 Tax=Streptomyces sp. ISL-100 TaxID=2819173 RepID=UPI0027E58C14|nr:DUF397 domain-containing protein [Streptomyces sp. ISL-100]
MTSPGPAARLQVKSSYSGAQGDDCVEVDACPDTVHVRDSKDRSVPVPDLAPRAWADFIVLATRG